MPSAYERAAEAFRELDRAIRKDDPDLHKLHAAEANEARARERARARAGDGDSDKIYPFD